MSNPFGWKFDETVSAFALFFKNSHGTRALRLEVPEIAMEFTDGLYIGQDPEGFLYYNKKEDFENDTNRKHNYRVFQSSVGSKNYAVIEFRKSASSEPYAKFYAPDKHRVATAADMGDYQNTGNWVTLKSASCYTIIEKSSSSSTVTMTLTSVDKVATWNGGSTSFSPSSFRVAGYLHYKRLNKLKDAIYANYNNDRVVFYENDWTGRDFVGFFIPLEDETQELGYKSTTSTPALTFTNVKWVDT